jgi:hypothetical protein
MTWTWITQMPHAASAEQTVLHVLVVNDDYHAFVQEILLDGQILYRAMVPDVKVQPRGKERPQYHYTHDSLQDAKDWCVAELVNRRLS